MVRTSHIFAVLCAVVLSPSLVSADPGAEKLNETLRKENVSLGIKAKPVAQIDDLAYLRRVSIDLIGRIPTHGEIDQYLSWNSSARRSKIVDKLMADPRFVDRWTTFFADMLRLRSNSPGGGAALAFVHHAIEQEMPYDEIASRFISANGKANAVPEVAYVLGDNADPMALAGVTAQVFMGVRIACAQCHDHPFDKWTREDFYGFAAYFGKTRRYENDFTNTVYTQEVNQTSILWPPEGEGDASDRKPMPPKFLVDLINTSATPQYIARLTAMRDAAKKAKLAVKSGTADIDALDDLLANVGEKALDRAKGKRPSEFDILGEAKKDREEIDLTAQFYKSSELRTRLASMVANPRNRYFSESFVNRVWKDLIGRGIVEPIDDFSDSNPPSHPKLLALLADEFVASGFQLKPLVRAIVASDAYQRGQALGLGDVEQTDLETAFLAVPARRMLSEVLYDSIVTAGDLFEYKHPQGVNMKTVSNRVRIAVQPDGEEIVQPVALGGNNPAMKPAMNKSMAKNDQGYNLEKGIEIDFDSVLKKAKEAQTEAVVVEKMVVKSQEELEAERMQMERPTRRIRYVYKMVSRTFDDNPSFNSSFRMASPSAPEHFIRVFGQTDRSQLGEKREHTPSMRQALMMLNGRMTHEASRVGPFEPMHKLLVGKKANLDSAVRLAYLQILTRKPAAHEVAVAKEIVNDADGLLEGMADLRWVLLNSNEFRYLP